MRQGELTMAASQTILDRYRGGGRESALRRNFALAPLAECGAFEWIALGYLILTALLMIAFRANLPRFALHFTIHLLALSTIISIPSAAGILRARKSPASRIFLWIRDWYPQAVFLSCFEELRILVHLIQPVWQDSVLIRFDRWLTGADPARWLLQFASPVANDAMQAAYLTYFFYLTILGASLYREVRTADHQNEFARRDEAYAAFWTAMTCSIAAYAIGYVTSILFPIESPFYAQGWSSLPALSGGPATALINVIERFGRVHGGAFPSAHVSGSFVALLSAWKYRKWLFWVFLPAFIAMCIATVYGRYHYIADVFAGMFVGMLGLWIGTRLMRAPGAVPGVFRRQGLD